MQENWSSIEEKVFAVSQNLREELLRIQGRVQFSRKDKEMFFTKCLWYSK
jgi:hypothetical protein